MSELMSLASEVAKCPRHEKSGKRIYSIELKRKICLVATSYSISKVARTIDISSSLISSWSKKMDISNDTEGSTYMFKELPPFAQAPQQSARPKLKLTAPSGHCLELDMDITSETVAIVKAFVGGAI